MKDVPFYANREDDMSCTLAVYRSILRYFTGKEYSWQEVEQLSGFQNGIAAWTVQIWTNLAKQGFDICMVENFDYASYLQKGMDYLQTIYKPEEIDWLLKHSNLANIKPFIPEFLKTIQHEQRTPQLSDIDAMLKDKYLVTVQVNSRALNDQPGYVAHMVLVTQHDDAGYTAHDPGLPPQANRHISRDQLWRAMGGDGNTTEVTGIKLKVSHG